jgi:hypothetical protein
MKRNLPYASFVTKYDAMDESDDSDQEKGAQFLHTPTQ